MDNIKELLCHESNSLLNVLAGVGWVPKKKSNNYSSGECPSGHPSEGKVCFVAYHNDNRYHCFSCGENGDQIDLLKLARGYDFGQSVGFLAKRAGVDPIKFLKGKRDPYNPTVLMPQIQKIMNDTTDFNHEKALKEEWFLKLMKDRYGLTEETIKRAKIGFSDGEGLYDFLKSKGHKMEDILSSGLFHKPGPSGPEEFFANRILFPYRTRKNTTYFVGRDTHLSTQIKEGGRRKKYIKQPVGNGSCPEISSDCITGEYIFNEDDCYLSKEILCSEGVTDALAAVQYGIPTISPVTTTFSSKQKERMKSLLCGKEITVVGDTEENDKGLSGAISTAKTFLDLGLKVKVCELPQIEIKQVIDEKFVGAFGLPGGKTDLNDFIRENGSKAWDYIKENAKPLAVFIVEKGLEKLPKPVGTSSLFKVYSDCLILPKIDLENLIHATEYLWGITDQDELKKRRDILLEEGKKKRASVINKRFADIVQNGHERGVCLNSHIPKKSVLDVIKSRLSNCGKVFKHGNLVVCITKDLYETMLRQKEFQTFFSSNICECFNLSIDLNTMVEKFDYKLLPAEIASGVVEAPWQFPFREVELHSKIPVLDSNFDLIDPGYNEKDKIFFTGPEVKSVEGTKTLDEVLDDFPWADKASKENYIMILLTAFAKHSFCGASPSGLVMGNQPGLGKTYLVQLYAYLVEGMEIPALNILGRFEEELQKQIVTALLPGRNVLLIDNVKAESLSSPTIESLITSEVLDIRILGRNTGLGRKNTVQFFFTLNDGDIAADILDRSLPVHLHYEGNPSEKDWKFTDFKTSAMERRTLILGELMWMWENWAKKGKHHSKRSHRFNRWGKVIGGVMEANGYNNFLRNIEAIKQQRDPVQEDLISLVESMKPKEKYTAGELVKYCKKKNLFSSQLEDKPERRCSQSLAGILSRFQGKQVQKCELSFVFMHKHDSAKNSKVYWVVPEK